MTSIKRDSRLDILRIVAILMIVLMHSPMPNSGAPGFMLASISYLTAPGLVLFFMISGSLLLDNKLTTKEFLKRRLSKILFPTLFWTLFYLLVRYVDQRPSITDALSSMLSIPFSVQGHGVLWFMYVLVGLYLLTPILSQWLSRASKREVEFYLLLWGVTLLYPYLSMWLQINDSASGVLYYFAGYVGYYVLGYYLKSHYEYRMWHIIVALTIAVFVPLTLLLSGIKFDFYSALWYLSLPVAMMAFAIFELIMQLPNRQMTIAGQISRLSFGIYFVHIFIMRKILWNLDVVQSLPWLAQIPVIVLSTFLLSLFTSWVISRFRFSKYIIGV